MAKAAASRGSIEAELVLETTPPVACHSEPEKTKEQRRHPRYSIDSDAEVYLPHGGLLLRGKILNVSFSGCYVEASHLSLKRGTHVEVSFVLNELRFRVAGAIVHNYREHAAGIAFLNVSPCQELQIAELVRELEDKSKEGVQPRRDHRQSNLP